MRVEWSDKWTITKGKKQKGPLNENCWARQVLGQGKSQTENLSAARTFPGRTRGGLTAPGRQEPARVFSSLLV